MKATYHNRYGDNIVFEEINDKTIEMTGYDQHYRVGYANDYSEAYEIYCMECKALTEPDMNLLVENVNENDLRPMTYQEFVQHMEDTIHLPSDSKTEPYHHYWKSHVKTDYDRYWMVDPSGGPYIAIGTDVGRYFDDSIQRRVMNIAIEKNKFILTVKKQKK